MSSWTLEEKIACTQVGVAAAKAPRRADTYCLKELQAQAYEVYDCIGHTRDASRHFLPNAALVVRVHKTLARSLA